jgi:very-short-patch-repair endonuclease
MSYHNILEEELKNKVAHDYFPDFDSTKIIGKVDFCVSVKNKNSPSVKGWQSQTDGVVSIHSKYQTTPTSGEATPPNIGEITQSLLWAEAKKGKSNIVHSIVQLILTIGRARTFDKELPPAYLGAFDAYQIAFIPYNDIQEFFYVNDFNWNVTPSNYDTKEFKLLHDKVKSTIEDNSLLFQFQSDDKEIRDFIKTNFIVGKSGTTKVQIDKNNFLVVYSKWLTAVKPSIIFPWENAKKHGIMDSDFYLADLFSEMNETIKDGLYAVLKKDIYEVDRKIDIEGFFSSKRATFNDGQKAHNQFWNKYARPPRQEYWDYILSRKDLLVPQDVRERKGSFFTPQIWVELSQKYLMDTLGDNWQDDYYIWDCAAGTGNLLAGLTNKYNIWASTLDQSDVDAMKDRIQNGANLLESHVFQFDFLNDEFSKVPPELYKILTDPEKRKKLVVYINPPYAEASNRDTVVGKGENKSDVATKTKIYEYFSPIVGTGARELFAQFFLRIYRDIPDCTMASFSTLKFVSSQNFLKFRHQFKAKFEKGFIVPANTFDNVEGQFPISFTVWNLENKQEMRQIQVDIFNKNNVLLGKKGFYSFDKGGFIIDWLRQFYDKKSERIAYLRMQGTDMQNNQGCFFTTTPTENDVKKCLTANITKNNLNQMAIYLTMRHFIEATWLNDRDQFLYPNDGWKSDKEFQNDCLAYTLFHGQNKITSRDEINHWIPFREGEVDAREKFQSHFMTDYMIGKLGEKIIQNSQIDENLELGNSPSVKGWQPQVDGVVSTHSNHQTTSPNKLGAPPMEENYSLQLNGQTSNENSASVDGVVSSVPRDTAKFMSLPYNPKLKDKAKELRQAGNLSEVILWNVIKNKQLLGLDFDRQKIIGNYIVDFYCPNLGLVIEIDGESHDFKGEYDVEREQFLKDLGLEIIHFEDITLNKDSATVGQQLYQVCGKLLSDLEYQKLPRQSAVPVSSQKENFPETNTLFEDAQQENFVPSEPLIFSPEATAVFDAGRELWKYYHSQPNVNPNASLYDIREYFQGRNAKGTMNSKSGDERYTVLIGNLRDALKLLANKIEPKVYEYGFLKR